MDNEDDFEFPEHWQQALDFIRYMVASMRTIDGYFYESMTPTFDGVARMFVALIQESSLLAGQKLPTIKRERVL